MVSDNLIETDVLVIGGSLAGSFAAIKAREEGLNVILVDKGFVGRSGAAMWSRETSIFNPEWGHNLNEWMIQIAKIGNYLNNPEWTEITLRESYDRYKDLVSWGVKFHKGKDGEPLRMTGHPQSKGVLESLDYGRGWTNLSIMRNQALKNGVKIMDRIMITDLMKQDGRVIGAAGFHTRSGVYYVFQAKATVICTGPGNMGSTHVGMPNMYDGEAMAYRAGAIISGKEFANPFTPGIDDHETTKVSIKGREIKLAPEDWHHHPRGAGAMVDSEGKVVNVITQSFISSVVTGHGPIYFDSEATSSLTFPQRVEHDEIDHGDKIDPTQRGLYLGTARFESNMGLGVYGGGSGIWSADTKGATSLPGLYAAGDCYHTGAVGAVYPSSGFGTRNAMVSGARAGRGASEYASKLKKITTDREEVDRLKSSIYAPLERSGGFDASYIITQLKSIMVPYYITILKREDRLKAALTLVGFFNNNIGPMTYCRPGDVHGLRQVHETKGRVLTAEMILRASLFRTESRGWHYREDYPRRDDPNWLAWVQIRERNGEMEMVKDLSPKKWWWSDLASIPYKERYPRRFLGEE
jgi:succinate dehydrogenase/fumarate reductase flavoprotein subunit